MSLTNVHSQWVRGALVFYQTHLKRIVDAIGADVVKYIDDFISFPVDDQTGDPVAWTTTMVEAGTGNSTVTSADASGGAIILTTDDNDNDGVTIQLNGESFILKSTNDVYFGVFGITVSEATQSDLFVGLCPTDTTIFTSDNARVGFQSVDASTDFVGLAGQTADISASLHTLTTTAFDAEFYWNGSAIETFIDGVSTGALVVTNVPTGELRVSIEWLNGLADTPCTVQFDKIVCVQIGR
jgi:hypothetical protein